MFSTIFGLSALHLLWIAYRYQGNGWSESPRMEEATHSNTDSGVRMGVRDSNPTEPEKTAVEKWSYFRRLYFSNKFDKTRLKFNFSIEFSSIISKFSQAIVFLVQTRENLTLSFEIFWKTDQNSASVAILLRKLYQILESSLASGGSSPRTPLRCRAYSWTPEIFPAYDTG